MSRYYERWSRMWLRRHGFRSHYTDTSVGRMHFYERAGDPRLPPLVLLHGITASGTSYAPLLRRLGWHQGQILVPDFPGHGFSAVPGRLDPTTIFQGIAEVLDGYLAGPAAVLGNSLGGAMALRYAYERPECVDALVLLSPAGAPLHGQELEDTLALFRMETLSQAREFTRRAYHKTPWYSGIVAREILHLFRQPHIRQFFDTLDPEEHARPEQLASLQVPILLAWGTSDKLLPASQLAYFRAHLPAHAEVMEPVDFSHSPYLEVPSAVSRIVREFVARPALPSR